MTTSGAIETKKAELEKLRARLEELKGLLPEHCSGTTEYMGVHRTSTKHWELIEETEEKIKKLEAELK